MSEQFEALDWVHKGEIGGWDQHRNSKGNLIAPSGYWALWDEGLVDHDTSGALGLTDKGEKVLEAGK